MDGPYDIVDPRGCDRKADVQFARSLGDGDYADIVTCHNGKQSPQDSARALHPRSENCDHSNVSVHGDRIQDSMFELSAEEPLECVDHSLRVGFSED